MHALVLNLQHESLPSVLPMEATSSRNTMSQSGHRRCGGLFPGATCSSKPCQCQLPRATVTVPNHACPPISHVFLLPDQKSWLTFWSIVAYQIRS
uniref:Uncharacterized protein n=1 Tax=Triticum urartu TaxID=4572 RepID=A0A8R7TJ23_TRIUA